MLHVVIEHNRVTVVGDHTGRHAFGFQSHLEHMPLYHPTQSSWERLLRHVDTKPIVRTFRGIIRIIIQ